jgi:hypothetical protein
MRKWLLILLTVLGLAATAQAQDFTIRAGANLYFTNPLIFGVDGRLYATNITRIAPNINLGIIGGVDLIFAGSVVGTVSAGPVVVFKFDSGRSYAYVGLNLAIGFSAGGSGVGFGFVGGVDYAINPSIGVFADLGLNVVNGVGGALSFGADFALSRSMDIYAKLNVGFAGTFGIGAGLKFAL